MKRTRIDRNKIKRAKKHGNNAFKDFKEKGTKIKGTNIKHNIRRMIERNQGSRIIE
jgi:hypothetical protein